MGDPDDEPEGLPALRRANRFAITAFLLAATSLLLPWWSLTASLQGVSGELVPAVGLWGPNPEVARPGAVWVTVALLAGGLALLFLRVAGASWRYEPAAFRRDTLLAALCLGLGCASAWFWPVEFPFWGTRAYTDNVTGEPTMVGGAAALGWWMAAVAAGAAFAAGGKGASTKSGDTQR